VDRSLPVDAAALRYPHFPSLKRSAGLVSIGREPRRDSACSKYSGVSWMSAWPYHVKSLVAPLLGCRIFHFGNVRCRAPPLGESTEVECGGTTMSLSHESAHHAYIVHFSPQGVWILYFLESNTMLVKIPSGTWLPSRVPESPSIIAILLLFCAMVESAVSPSDASATSYTDFFQTNGFDGSLLNGLK
jgi:hypothetical protein